MKTTLKFVRAPMAKRWWTESARAEVENNMFWLERIAILYGIVAALLLEPANEWVLPLILAAATTAALHFHRPWCLAVTLRSSEPESPYWIRQLLFWVERLCFLLSFLMVPRPTSVFYATLFSSAVFVNTSLVYFACYLDRRSDITCSISEGNNEKGNNKNAGGKREKYESKVEELKAERLKMDEYRATAIISAKNSSETKLNEWEVKFEELKNESLKSENDVLIELQNLQLKTERLESALLETQKVLIEIKLQNYGENCESALEIVQESVRSAYETMLGWEAELEKLKNERLKFDNDVIVESVKSAFETMLNERLKISNDALINSMEINLGRVVNIWEARLEELKDEKLKIAKDTVIEGVKEMNRAEEAEHYEEERRKWEEEKVQLTAKLEATMAAATIAWMKETKRAEEEAQQYEEERRKWEEEKVQLNGKLAATIASAELYRGLLHDSDPFFCKRQD